MNRIPTEIYRSIICNIKNTIDLKECRLVCTRWRDIINTIPIPNNLEYYLKNYRREGIFHAVLLLIRQPVQPLTTSLRDKFLDFCRLHHMGMIRAFLTKFSDADIKCACGEVLREKNRCNFLKAMVFLEFKYTPAEFTLENAARYNVLEILPYTIDDESTNCLRAIRYASIWNNIDIARFVINLKTFPRYYSGIDFRYFMAVQKGSREIALMIAPYLQPRAAVKILRGYKVHDNELIDILSYRARLFKRG